MHSNPICHLSPAKKIKSSFLDYIQILMIGRAGQWTWTPSTTSLQPKKWNAHFWIMFNFWWLAGLVNGLEPCVPPLCSQKNEMLIFGLHSTSDDCWGWSIDSNPIHHPSTPKKMKCPFLDYIQILMISQVGPWTRTAPATHLQPKKWNPHFWNTFNSWWSAGLVDGLEPHLPRLSSQKHEILIFGFHWTSDDWPGWSMDLNPIYHLSPAKKMKCSFLDYVQLLMIGRAGRWTWALCATSLQPKKWNAHFWVTFNFWWSARLVDGLEPHLQPLSSQKKLNALFWITFNFWWLPGLINWLELHPPPLSSQKNEMSIFRLQSTSDDQPGWSMDLNPICHLSPAKKMKCSFLDYIQLLMISRAGRWTWTPSTTSLQPKKWNAHFWITFNFWWSAGLEPHLPPLSRTRMPSTTPLQPKNEMLIFGLRSTSDDQPGWSMDSNPICNPSPAKKNEMLIFGLRSTSDDQPGWSMDSNPICHPSPAKKMKCSFLDYVQLLMISPAGQWTQIPSATSLQPKKWNVHFWITFNFWWSARLVNGLEPHLPPLSSQENEMLIFGLCSTSDDQPGWSMDLNPICHPSPAKNMKCLFLDYIQLLMFSWIGQWTRMPSTTLSSQKKLNAHFKIMFNFWRLAGLVNGLKPHLPPLSSQKKWNPHFWITFKFWCLAGWSMDLNPICHLSPAKKNEMLIFGLHSNSDDQPGWSMELNPIYHLSPAKKMKCSFLDYIQILMISQAGWWTRTPSATPLQPKEWNPNFWNTFNFSCLAGLVDGLELHLPPISSQKNEMLIFGLCSTSDDQPGWSMDLNPICNPSPANKMKCSFLEYIQLLMISQAG